MLGHGLLSDVEEGGNEAEGKDAGGDATSDQPSFQLPACSLTIH